MFTDNITYGLFVAVFVSFMFAWPLLYKLLEVSALPLLVEQNSETI